MVPESYRSGPTRRRRTRDEIREIEKAIWDIAEEERPVTVRRIFYALTTLGLVEKTESDYKQTVCRLTKNMRLRLYDPEWRKLAHRVLADPSLLATMPLALDFEAIADNSRWQRKPKTFNSVEDALRETAEFYRRSLWHETDAYVEIWLEKEALSGVVLPVTAEYDVPLMITRGYPSLSFLHEAAEAMQDRNQEIFIYYLGDHDPSGVDIARNVEERLEQFTEDADVTFERVAVTPEQIEAWDLPSRPTKKTDTRSKGFDSRSVELDAIPTDQLRDLVRDCIEQHVDDHQLGVLEAAEQSEREVLEKIAATAGAAA